MIIISSSIIVIIIVALEPEEGRAPPASLAPSLPSRASLP